MLEDLQALASRAGQIPFRRFLYITAMRSNAAVGINADDLGRYAVINKPELVSILPPPAAALR
jgi:hypothetical protein